MYACVCAYYGAHVEVSGSQKAAVGAGSWPAPSTMWVLEFGFSLSNQGWQHMLFFFFFPTEPSLWPKQSYFGCCFTSQI